MNGESADSTGRGEADIHLLLVDDDRELATMLQEYLEPEGFAVDWAGDGPTALQRLGEATFDLVILDVMMPVMNGFEVLRRIRAEGDTPVLMLTARGDDVDRIVGLEIGADDYVVKPFSFRELVARIRAVARRGQPRHTERRVEEWNGLHLDRGARRVRVHGVEVALTPKEYGLLALLMEEPGVVVTRRRILERVWDTTWYGPSRSLDVHVASLRRKLGDAALVETVRGVGFRMGAEDDGTPAAGTPP